jgi:hypothetical protein
MNKAQVKNYSDDHLDFAINDLMEVIKIQKAFENPTVAQKMRLARYHRDLLLVTTEKVERYNLNNPHNR